MSNSSLIAYIGKIRKVYFEDDPRGPMPFKAPNNEVTLVHVEKNYLAYLEKLREKVGEWP